MTLKEARLIVEQVNTIAAENTEHQDAEATILEFRQVFESALTDTERDRVIDLAHENKILAGMFQDFWGALPE